MASFKNKIIEAIRIGDSDAGRIVGSSLRALRDTAGITQSQMAQRLGVNRALISKIEHRGNVQISSLQRYVEALGARLRIDATFPAGADLAASLHSVLGGHVEDDDQYVLPIFGDTRHKRRDVVLSIKPAYSAKILNGVKTVELRRRFPISAAEGTTAYIYSTSPIMALVGTAEISAVERLPISTLWRQHGGAAAIAKCDFDSYFDGLRDGYALKISSARPLHRPLNLAELRERFDFRAPQSFLYVKPSLQRALQDEQSDLSN